MPLIKLEDLSLSYSAQPLLDHADFQILAGEKLCIVGRNGTGKTSLFKLIRGVYQPDGGKVYISPNTVITELTQALPEAPALSVYDFVALGLSELGQLLADFDQLTQRGANLSEQDLKHLETIQNEIEKRNGWQQHQQIEKILEQLDLPHHTQFETLSGGWKRKALLAQCLVQKPDILLLDEPTNHLDISTIQWLEQSLRHFQGAVLCISHDRAFIDSFADSIVELDRGKLYTYPGTIAEFTKAKDKRLDIEAKENAEFDKKLAKEEQWIRQGIKARRTRNQGRVRALHALRAQYSKRLKVMHTPKFKLSESELSGQLVIRATNISYQYNEHPPLIKDFSIDIFRGDRIGLIGDNGSGKSTLIKLLLGQLQPTQGEVRLGTQLKIAYFDQLRASLDPTLSIVENVADGRTSIQVGGKDKHVVSYLSDFLFAPDRVHAKITTLSGGEYNRLLLAKLFSHPFNLLVMDEPTNDLDIESLELLEELLIEYQGTLLLVSHDRVFMDNVVTSTIAFEDNGHLSAQVGGYSDRQLKPQASTNTKPLAKEKTPITQPHKSKKLTQKEQRELQELHKRIEKLEQEVESLQQQIADPAFYQQSQTEVVTVNKKLSAKQDELDRAYLRWEELESE